MPRDNTDSGPKLSPDIASFLGLVLAVASIAGGLLLEGGRVADILKPTAALIVLGGTLGAVLVTTPTRIFLGGVARLVSVFVDRPPAKEELLQSVLRFAERARRNGLAALESEADQVGDRFLRKALNLAVDGTDNRELRNIMQLEIHAADERAESEAKVWDSAAGYAPTIGIIGAVLGLIQVMKHLDKLDEVGSGIAVAFVATVYGVASANILFLPAAGKLRARAQALAELQEMIVEGVLAIAEGMNPKLIRIKLEAFVDPAKAGRAPQEIGAARSATAAVGT